MPSSTSSSNTRLPDAPYGRLWVVTLSLFLITLAFFEWFFRQQGHSPSVADSMRFWAMHRADVYQEGGKKRIVIVGRSRSHVGLVPREMERLIAPFRIKQLANDGKPPFGIVQDLCEDPSFNGLLLWDAEERWLFPASPDSEEQRSDYVYPRFFHDDFQSFGSVDKNLNCVIGAKAQDLLVTLAPHLTLRSLLRSRFRPEPDYGRMHLDRFRPLKLRSGTSQEKRHELARINVENARTGFRGFDSRRFDEVAETVLRRLAQEMRSKGGDLVLLRMPTKGELWAVDDSAAPKERFWDRIHDLSGVTTIHFKDYPELGSFDCPDGSHLDASDAPEFTRRLALILRKKLEEDGVLPSSVRSERGVSAHSR